MCRYILKPCPGLTPSRLSKGIFIFSGETPPDVLPPALGSQHLEEVELLEQVQRRPQRCSKGGRSSAMETG